MNRETNERDNLEGLGCQHWMRLVEPEEEIARFYDKCFKFAIHYINGQPTFDLEDVRKIRARTPSVKKIEDATWE